MLTQNSQLHPLDPVFRLDNEWHHIAATWSWEDGQTQLFFDGQQLKPYFKREGFQSELKSPEEGGVDDHMAAKTTRSEMGKLPSSYVEIGLVISLSTVISVQVMLEHTMRKLQQVLVLECIMNCFGSICQNSRHQTHSRRLISCIVSLKPIRQTLCQDLKGYKISENGVIQNSAQWYLPEWACLLQALLC